PGEHFVVKTVDRIAPAMNRLLAEPEQLRLMRERAYDFVRERLPMEPAGKRLAELAAELPRQPPGRRASPSPALAAQPPTPPPPARSPSSQSAPPVEVAVSPWLLRSLYARLRGGARGERVRILRQSSAYAQATPRVSVILAGIEDRQQESIRALESAAGSQYDAFELLVLGEASNGRSAAAVSGFLDDHPTLPALLLQQPVDHGLGRSLNLLAQRARGEYLFVLDAMGEIYPSTLGRLLTALAADPDATFAYPMVAAFEGDRPVELLGSLPWEPERLERGNWIDAMALLRRAPLLELGGYPTDPSLAGRESFELWRRCAAAGGHGVHVAQVLARRELRDPS
ncbi:MAG TPA: glycosyltransferase, partial [Solirubrobacteraceae bacterium]|nr:glycosyltransferase [Solirubrobacteraceae bacterium]